jgi:hypothetical protein
VTSTVCVDIAVIGNLLSSSFVYCVIIVCLFLLPHVYCCTVYIVVLCILLYCVCIVVPCILLHYVCIAVLHTVVAPDCWPEVSIRKVLRPATSAQVFLGFSVSISEC